MSEPTPTTEPSKQMDIIGDSTAHRKWRRIKFRKGDPNTHPHVMDRFLLPPPLFTLPDQPLEIPHSSSQFGIHSGEKTKNYPHQPATHPHQSANHPHQPTNHPHQPAAIRQPSAALLYGTTKGAHAEGMISTTIHPVKMVKELPTVSTGSIVSGTTRPHSSTHDENHHHHVFAEIVEDAASLNHLHPITNINITTTASSSSSSSSSTSNTIALTPARILEGHHTPHLHWNFSSRNFSFPVTINTSTTMDKDNAKTITNTVSTTTTTTSKKGKKGSKTSPKPEHHSRRLLAHGDLMPATPYPPPQFPSRSSPLFISYPLATDLQSTPSPEAERINGRVVRVSVRRCMDLSFTGCSLARGECVWTTSCVDHSRATVDGKDRRPWRCHRQEFPTTLPALIGTGPETCEATRYCYTMASADGGDFSGALGCLTEEELLKLYGPNQAVQNQPGCYRWYAKARTYDLCLCNTFLCNSPDLWRS